MMVRMVSDRLCPFQTTRAPSGWHEDGTAQAPEGSGRVNPPHLSEGAGKIDQVFDAEFSRDLAQRYGPWLGTHRPEYYLTAASPDRAEERSWINEALSLMPEPGQAKLWGRLTDDNHFFQTYNELATIGHPSAGRPPC